MAAPSEDLVNVAADLTVSCHESNRLPDFLREMSVRLDLAGAGPVLDEWARRRVHRSRRRLRWLRGGR